MSIYDDVVQLTNRMTLAEKARLLEHLSTALRHDIQVEAYRHIPWDQFINLTYGSLANDPIERQAQPPMDVRDQIERSAS